MLRAWGLAAVALGVAAASLAVPVGGQMPLGGLYGGVMEVAVKQPLSFSPTSTAADDTLSWRAMQAAYDGLARLNPQTGVPEPSLAESWAVNATARTVTATLRMGLKWADGTPLTPAAVVTSYAQYGIPATVVNQTIVFGFGAGGGGDFLTAGVTLPIAWKEGGTPGYSGPFQIVSQTGTEWVLAANEFHYRGRPNLDGITFRVYGNYTMDIGGGRTLGCDLVNRVVDYVTFFPDPSELTLPVTCNGTPTSYKVSDLIGPTAPSHLFPPSNSGFSLLFLGFNTSSTSPTNDSALRKAVALAADKDAFTKTIITTSRLADAPIPAAFTFWYNTTVPRWQAPKVVRTGATVATFDPSQSIAVLSAANYEDAPPQDGFLDNNQSGSPQAFLLTFVIPSFTKDAKAATIGAGIANNLVDVGLNVQVVEEDPVNITGRINAGTYDVVLWRMPASASPNFLYDLFHTGGSRNRWNYANTTLDALLDAQRNEVDLDRRAELVMDVLGGVAWDLPILPLLFEDVAEVVNVCRDSDHCGDFQGYVDAPDGLLHYLTFTNVHVTQYGPVEVELTAVERSLRSGDNTTLIVRVRGAVALGGALAPLAGVPVTLSTPDGTFYTDVTGIDGTLQTTYTAAAVNTTADVELQAEVRVPGYEPARAAAFVTVAPADRTLRVTVSAEQRNLRSGDATTVRVIVNDPNGDPLANASVIVAIGPADLGGGASPLSGTTDASGAFATTFQANVSTDATFQVKARASVQGFDEGQAFTSVVVAGPAPPSGVIPVLDLVAVIVLIAVLAWVVLNFLAARSVGPLKPKAPDAGPSKPEKK